MDLTRGNSLGRNQKPCGFDTAKLTRTELCGMKNWTENVAPKLNADFHIGIKSELTKLEPENTTSEFTLA